MYRLVNLDRDLRFPILGRKIQPAGPFSRASLPRKASLANLNLDDRK